MKQKMKKVLPVLLALSMLFSLVACDGSTGETGDGWQLRREKLTQEEMDSVDASVQEYLEFAQHYRASHE